MVETMLESGQVDLGPTLSMEFMSRAILPTYSGENILKLRSFFKNVLLQPRSLYWTPQ